MQGVNTNVVGEIRFDNRILTVYSSLDEPLFRGSEVAELIDYSDAKNTWKLKSLCEADEYLNLPVVGGGQRRLALFVTEMGLYNILSQSRMPLARKWRRVVHEQLIEMRRNRHLTIEQQFEEWNNAIDNIYYDEEKDCLMGSVTVPGGDVEQIPVE